jgi:hypothetical protein
VDTRTICDGLLLSRVLELGARAGQEEEVEGGPWMVDVVCWTETGDGCGNDGCRVVLNVQTLNVNEVLRPWVTN